MPKVAQAKRPKPVKVRQIDEWRVIDRRIVGVHEGKMLVWLLIVQDDGTSSWKPYYLAEDGITILEEPAFCPLPGSQYVFLSSPIFETLYAGNRGGGKSDSLLLSFASGVGKGYGKGYRGILFRKEFGDLDDIVRKVETLFPRIYGDDNFRFLKSKSEYTCVWKTGEALLLRNLPSEDAYREYHGHCVDEGEVLTPDRGWVDIRLMCVGDLVYTFDADGELMESVVSEVHAMDYDGDVIRCTGNKFYASFTPAHKLAVAQPGGHNLLIPFDQIGGQADLVRAITHYPGTPTAEWAERAAAVGWWFACGRMRNGRAEIAPPTPKAAEAFRKSGASVELAMRREKRIPRDLMNAPPEVLRQLLEALIRGSGLWRKASVDGVVNTMNSQLADDVSEIGVKLGFNVSVRQAGVGSGGKHILYSVSLTPAKPKRINTSDVRCEPFTGKVYCIGVPLTHSFVIRQRGCVWLSGNSYAWIGFEELTQWPDDKAYKLMFSCLRSPEAGVPVTGVRATTNPYGIGHNWVKKRFRLPHGFGKVIRVPGEDPRVAIESDLRENFVLLHNNPGYPNRIRSAAANPAQAKAWVDGDWDVTTGGMFDDLWNNKLHVVPNIIPSSFPLGWRLNRSYDHGSSKPFCVLWWAESNGEPAHFADGRMIGQVRGDIVLFAEWYGTSGQPDTGVRMPAWSIGNGIIERQRDWRISHRVKVGPADANIYSKDTRTQARSPSDDMEAAGVWWERADMSAGSRKRGYQMIRARLAGAYPNVDGTRDSPALFVCQRCEHWLELVPSAPRDPADQDELPKGYEDHCVDATRYRLSTDETAVWQRGF